jgi:hypothetical protein
MEHKKFLEQYDWKFYNYDTAYWPECVDLFKGYYRDVKEYRINVSLWSAKNYWISIEKAGFTRTTTPVQWDAAFSDYTQWWHVGIFERFWTLWWVKWFYQFDQLGNWEKVWGEKPCKLRFYPMSKLLWFATINKPDPTDKIVNDFADKYDIKWRSKTEPYTQYETLIILYRIKESKK